MKAHQKLQFSLLLVALWFGIGCDSTAPAKVGQATSAAQVKTAGTVVFREANGQTDGFYGILTDKGGQFEPKNLDQKFQTDGLRISFSGSLDSTHLGDHHWGNPISLAKVNIEQ